MSVQMPGAARALLLAAMWTVPPVMLLMRQFIAMQTTLPHLLAI